MRLFEYIYTIIWIVSWNEQIYKKHNYINIIQEETRERKIMLANLRT